MGIGLGIFLLALGAILTFAVHATVAGLDVQVIGIILMAAGAIGLTIDLAILRPRRTATVYDTPVIEHREVRRDVF